MSRRTEAAALAKQQKVTRILDSLERAYGPRRWDSRGRCLDELVYAMLSQNTNIANASSGYRQLRRRFNSWAQVMNADVRDVQRQIAVCGLARMRARRLQALLREIKRQRGTLNLQFLGDQEPQQAYDYLTSFFGIGPKTAAYTLLFAFGTPLFPVDNGIMRMTRRLRLVRAKAREREVEQTMERLTLPAQRYPLHVLMFNHAKHVCRPRNPKCNDCGLSEYCPYGQRRLRHAPPEKELDQLRMRPVILSRFISDGLSKRSDDDEARRHRV